MTPPPHEGGSNGEFIVHTKHTCDKCFQRPIIGQRFKSDVNPNFDLCAHCFQAYSGPDIGLTEAVLMRDKKLSRDFVLKLKIINGGEVQIRRVKVSAVWGGNISHLSFKKMMSLAASFTLPKNEVDDAGLAAFTAKAKATYIDEDGDEITLTSNDELDDAFRQVLERARPFLITVTIPQDQVAGKVFDGKKGMPSRIKVRKIEPSKKLLALSNDKSPSAGCKSTNSFIHARHTCDGCQKTPIIGARYHATKIPDFDLCATCFEKYEGDDLDFKIETQERDRCMQQRWLNKGLCHASSPNVIAGIWDSTNGDLADFLKKVQESGASIESATVFHARPTCNAVPEIKSPEKLPTKADADSLKEVEKPLTNETVASLPSISRSSESPTSRGEESFSPDADDIGSIAKAIGHTLGDCVAAIEAAMIEEFENSEDDFNAAAPINLPSVNDSAHLLTKDFGCAKDDEILEQGKHKKKFNPCVEGVNDEDEDEEWSVVNDDDDKAKPDSKRNQPASSALSPVVIAKWDTELRQLHEMGFFDDCSNIDSLEHLEAAHIGVDSTEKVSVNAAVEHILGRLS
ncbi:hypothetical protein ACHAXA_007311 [Cyclostephanos tholiformis]|uniref:ZZ-type domain-containing protein n=1 Tax=Cyclostephanos tholiformis TaxID=382380 RepID=A0ABD3RVF6_9STRA